MVDKRLLSELIFKTSKSGGPGGQHVNKTETKVEILFDVKNSAFLSFQEKRALIGSLNNKINANGYLSIVVSETRSQKRNKEIAIERFFSILHKGLQKRKKRIATKTPKKAIRKRLEAKGKRSKLKKSRGNVSNQDY